MRTYVLRRILLAVPTLFGLAVLLFVYTRALPGDPAEVILGQHATSESIARLRQSMGLDDPLPVQFVRYIADLVQGDLGVSAVTRRPVIDDFLQRFPATLELSLFAILFAILVGLPLGRAAAKRPNSAFDGGATIFAVLGISIPVFVSALLAQWVFAVQLGWLPAIGRIDAEYSVASRTNLMLVDTLLAGQPASFANALAHLILPGVILGMLSLAVVSRITRASFRDAMQADYVRTARAKGLERERIERRHIMRNAWLPVVTVIGLQVGALLAGAVITESIFGWGGVGSWLINAIRTRDYITMQSGIMIIAAIFVAINLVVDLLYAALDPRIRYS